jgi:hypothetical protein
MGPLVQPTSVLAGLSPARLVDIPDRSGPERGVARWALAVCVTLFVVLFSSETLDVSARRYPEVFRGACSCGSCRTVLRRGPVWGHSPAAGPSGRALSRSRVPGNGEIEKPCLRLAEPATARKMKTGLLLGTNWANPSSHAYHIIPHPGHILDRPDQETSAITILDGIAVPAPVSRAMFPRQSRRDHPKPDGCRHPPGQKVMAWAASIPARLRPLNDRTRSVSSSGSGTTLYECSSVLASALPRMRIRCLRWRS